MKEIIELREKKFENWFFRCFHFHSPQSTRVEGVIGTLKELQSDILTTPSPQVPIIHLRLSAIIK